MYFKLLTSSPIQKKQTKNFQWVLLHGVIHTLFDLNLIGIDQGGVVHISEELISSEYGIYSGDLIAVSIPQETKNNLKERFENYFILMNS